MRGYFITGTDTNVGKTLASAVLMLILKGCYWKPIQSGIESEPSDCQQVQRWTGLPAEYFFPSTYQLKASLSPDQAAAAENISIDLACCELPVVQKPLIVEGAGGLYVPLNAQQRIIDLIHILALPVIVVARGTLGTINHTLLTLDILRQHQLPVHGVIFSGELNIANQQAIEKWGQVRSLFHIPFFAKIDPFTLQRWIYEYTITA